MEFYFAPLEGITTYTYRNLFNKYFKGVDKYFMPFVAPGSSKGLKKREIKDVLSENNMGINVVPQILTNNAELFLETERQLGDFGYDEININLGCPVGTVVAKNKGAGMLWDTYKLEKFLDEIFLKTHSKISIKTRIGMEFEEEFEEILDLYLKYPLHELIVHPRLRTDYYKNEPHMNIYKEALEKANEKTDIPVCYNGDINNVSDYKKIVQNYPKTSNVMIGRGLVANPFLLMEIRETGEWNINSLKDFLNELVDAYISEMGENNALFKMKEIWFYLSGSIEDGEKILKRIRKAKSMADYKMIVEQVHLRSLLL